MHLTAKDRLIAALVAQLRAERETRDALAFVIANGQLDGDVLTAILTDPVPVFTQDDLNRADALSRQDLSGQDLSGKALSRQNLSRKKAPRRGGQPAQREAA
ncbi:hypothetical protein [Bosea psychrotolerans]|uniref:Uncharacterized protein n=1 Tax=Bosea psychrotolerans TaxID=1871628 RepID=A0A2S4MCL7_9HYPH|nr:hypothetical protein [Bosea psychrotolerans]POR52482.1 hypothetical protein CYD53_105147 [Bosea psychrotolerans]